MLQNSNSLQKPLRKYPENQSIFYRARRDASMSPPGRQIFGQGPKPLAARHYKDLTETGTTHEKSLVPRVLIKVDSIETGETIW